VIATAVVIPFLVAAPAGADVPSDAAPVQVTAGATTSGIDLTMSRGTGSISGTLVDEDTGAGVVHAHVSAYDSSRQVWARARTDTSGHFTLDQLPSLAGGYRVCMSAGNNSTRPDQYPGQYALICYPHSYRADAIPSGATSVSLGDDEHKDLGTIAVRQGGLIRGRIESAHGNPLRAAGVYVRSLSHPDLSFTTTSNNFSIDARDGRFAVGPLPPSPKGWQVCSDARRASVPYDKPTDPFSYASTCYKTTPWVNLPKPSADAAAVKVAAGHALIGLHLVSVLAGGVKGRASYPGGKPASGTVSVSSIPGHPVAAAKLTNGRYRIRGLSPGRQELRFCAHADGANYVGHCTTRTVRVRPHEYVTGGPHLHLTRGVRISGTVSDPPGDQVTQFVQVHVFTPDDPTGGAYSQLDSAGRYRVAGLPPSKSGYYVCASTLDYADQPNEPGSGCYQHGTWSGARGDTPVGAHLVQVSNGRYRTGVDFELPHSGSISGTVRAADGTPISTPVEVYDASGDQVTYDFSSHDDGTYMIESLSPGKYFVCASGSPDYDYTDDGACYQHAVLPPPGS
jgi:hypothetical protein